MCGKRTRERALHACAAYRPTFAVMRLAVRADSLDCIAAPDMPAAGPSSGHCIPVAITSISSVCMAIVGLPAPVCVPFALFWERERERAEARLELVRRQRRRIVQGDVDVAQLDDAGAHERLQTLRAGLLLLRGGLARRRDEAARRCARTTIAAAAVRRTVEEVEAADAPSAPGWPAAAAAAPSSSGHGRGLERQEPSSAANCPSSEPACQGAGASRRVGLLDLAQRRLGRRRRRRLVVILELFCKRGGERSGI